jgi:hypothetical protein
MFAKAGDTYLNIAHRRCPWQFALSQVPTTVLVNICFLWSGRQECRIVGVCDDAFRLEKQVKLFVRNESKTLRRNNRNWHLLKSAPITARHAGTHYTVAREDSDYWSTLKAWNKAECLLTAAMLLLWVKPSENKSDGETTVVILLGRRTRHFLGRAALSATPDIFSEQCNDHCITARSPCLLTARAGLVTSV